MGSRERSAFGLSRTANACDDGHVVGERLVVDALNGLGVRASLPAGPGGGDGDVVVEPGRVIVEVKQRSLVTPDVAERLLAEPLRNSQAVLLVVGDRISEKARRFLVGRNAGYYDLRGHLVLRADSLVIDADVEPLIERSGRKQALEGKAGLEIAVALLMDPSAGASVRELARSLGRSPSTVSDVFGLLRRDGLVDDHQRVADTRLFWAVVDRWPTSRVHLAQVPPSGAHSRVSVPLGLGMDDPERSTGWALTDSAAAAAYGAPVAFRTGQLYDFYVPDQVTIRRAATLLGSAHSAADARCAVRVAPVPAVCRNRVLVESSPIPWPLAHPLFVALDLAQDVGRGREILDAWTPRGWPRVW